MKLASAALSFFLAPWAVLSQGSFDISDFESLLGSSNLNIQEILAGRDSIDLGGLRISLANIKPLEIHSAKAKVVLDGERESDPSTFLFTSDDDLNIRIALNPTGELLSASLVLNSGVAFDVVRVDDSDLFVSYSSTQISDEFLSSFTLEDKLPDLEGRRSLRSLPISSRLVPATYERNLQGSTCSEYDVIEMTIVVDSLLCAEAGGPSQAEALVQTVVADASATYSVPGLCVKLKLLDTILYCDSSSDPIRPMLDSTGTDDVCDTSNSLLNQFTNFVRQEDIRGDVVHLFHGKDFTGTSTIGCAWVGTLCRTDGVQSGVNEMSYTSSPWSRAKLLAHENGHICSARHSTDTGDIMFGRLCSTCNEFGAESKSSIRSRVDATQCTNTESGQPMPTPVISPTPVPTARPQPDPTPPPTPEPTSQPIPNPTPPPTLSVTPQPVQTMPTPVISPTPVPTVRPVPNPTPPPTPQPVSIPVPRPTSVPQPNPTPSPVETDVCEDQGSFTVNGVKVTCALVAQSLYSTFICVNFAEARQACPQTCDSCF